MKTKKFWGVLALLAFAFGMCFTAISCSSSSSDDEGGSSSGNGSSQGGGTTAATIVGSYNAITKEDRCKISVIFADNGTGVITEKYVDSYSGSGTYQTSFTYSMAGDTGILKKDGDSYSGSSKAYTIKFVEGFMFIEESDGDIELVLYKNGQDLGKADTKKLIGTWEYKGVGELLSLTFNNDGTGNMIEEWKSGSYSERIEEAFTYRMKNAYVVECDVLAADTHHDSELGAVIGDKLYWFDSDGEVDSDQILTKK